MADDLGKNIAEVAKYFGKKKVGKEPTLEKMEEAAGITPPSPAPPPPPSEGKSTGENRDVPRQKVYK